MGYEIKLHIGQTIKFDWENQSWFQEIAMIDLCKPGHDSEIYRLVTSHKKDDLVYLFASDGNTKLTEDAYGEALSAIDAKLVLEALEISNKNDPYRRFKIAIALLKSMLKDKEWKHNLKIVAEGH